MGFYPPPSPLLHAKIEKYWYLSFDTPHDYILWKNFYTGSENGITAAQKDNYWQYFGWFCLFEQIKKQYSWIYPKKNRQYFSIEQIYGKMPE